jgi:hypothetical protein
MVCTFILPVSLNNYTTHRFFLIVSALMPTIGACITHKKGTKVRKNGSFAPHASEFGKTTVAAAWPGNTLHPGGTLDRFDADVS